MNEDTEKKERITKAGPELRSVEEECQQEGKERGPGRQVGKTA
jgi:hypothetical protein